LTAPTHLALASVVHALSVSVAVVGTQLDLALFATPTGLAIAGVVNALPIARAVIVAKRIRARRTREPVNALADAKETL